MSSSSMLGILFAEKIFHEKGRNHHSPRLREKGDGGGLPMTRSRGLKKLKNYPGQKLEGGNAFATVRKATQTPFHSLVRRRKASGGSPGRGFGRNG